MNTSLAFPSDRYFAQDGPLAVVTSKNWTGADLIDLQAQAMTPLVETKGHQSILGLDLSGTRAAWAIGEWSGNRNTTPCASQGSLTWAVYVRDLQQRTQTEITSGKNSDVIGCAALEPPIAIDDDLIAYVIEQPRSDAPHATTIVVQSLSSGETVRTIKSDVIVEDLDLSAGDVAYVEGRANDGDPYDPVDPTWLMISTVDQPTPVRIAANIDGLSFSGGRIAWGSTDQSDSQSYMTATVPNGHTVVVANRSGPPWSDAFASDHLVSFGSHAGINLWDEASSDLFTVWPYSNADPSHGSVDAASTDGGWLVWTGYIEVSGQIENRVEGLPVSSLQMPR